jgi:hypothetical protein
MDMSCENAPFAGVFAPVPTPSFAWFRVISGNSRHGSRHDSGSTTDGYLVRLSQLGGDRLTEPTAASTFGTWRAYRMVV